MTNIEDNPYTYFEKKRIKFSKSLDEITRKIRIISFVRIIVFLITIIGIYISVAHDQKILAIIFSSGFVLFIYLVWVHARLETKKEWNQTLVDINLKEQKLLDGNTEGMDNGSEFLQPSHAYNEDLDIFGDRSLFQLINRTATANGRTALAAKLNNLITYTGNLIARQDAISELCNKPDWRQNFQATANIFNEKKEDIIELLAWSKNHDVNFNTLFYRIMLVINPLLGFGILALIEFDLLTINSFLLFLILPLVLVGTKLAVLNRVHMQVSKKSGLLLKYAKLFTLITKEDYNSDFLVNIKQRIVGKVSAYKAVTDLAKITKSMDYRLNMLVGIFLNVFFLWDIKQAIKVENWKSYYAGYLEEWFNQLYIIDEIQSFSGFAFNFPNSTYPKYSNGSFKIMATNVYHPFLAKHKCVGNDIEIDGWKQFQIITGANMAGKSTYLRTVGINMVLSMTGSPVLADSFVVKPVNIFTGIKTSDSLQDGESYFFAELKRLKELIDKLESGQKLFVILDELLRGTNSADKQKGSMALIAQLIRLSSSGLIATHDLALGNLAVEFPNKVQNKRFEVEIANNELIFDYKLKDGISQNLNASFLMKKMGITV